MELLFSHARDIIRKAAQASLQRFSCYVTYTAFSRTEMERKRNRSGMAE